MNCVEVQEKGWGSKLQQDMRGLWRVKWIQSNEQKKQQAGKLHRFD